MASPFRRQSNRLALQMPKEASMVLGSRQLPSRTHSRRMHHIRRMLLLLSQEAALARNTLRGIQLRPVPKEHRSLLQLPVLRGVPSVVLVWRLVTRLP